MIINPRITYFKKLSLLLNENGESLTPQNNLS